MFTGNYCKLWNRLLAYNTPKISSGYAYGYIGVWRTGTSQWRCGRNRMQQKRLLCVDEWCVKMSSTKYGLSSGTHLQYDIYICLRPLYAYKYRYRVRYFAAHSFGSYFSVFLSGFRGAYTRTRLDQFINDLTDVELTSCSRSTKRSYFEFSISESRVPTNYILYFVLEEMKLFP